MNDSLQIYAKKVTVFFFFFFFFFFDRLKRLKMNFSFLYWHKAKLNGFLILKTTDIEIQIYISFLVSL